MHRHSQRRHIELLQPQPSKEDYRSNRFFIKARRSSYPGLVGRELKNFQDQFRSLNIQQHDRNNNDSYFSNASISNVGNYNYQSPYRPATLGNVKKPEVLPNEDFGALSLRNNVLSSRGSFSYLPSNSNDLRSTFILDKSMKKRDENNQHYITSPISKHSTHCARSPSAKDASKTAPSISGFSSFPNLVAPSTFRRRIMGLRSQNMIRMHSSEKKVLDHRLDLQLEHILSSSSRLDQIIVQKLDMVSPSRAREQQRTGAVKCIHELIKRHSRGQGHRSRNGNVQVYSHGSYASKTYLPDSTVDVAAYFVTKFDKKRGEYKKNFWAQQVAQALASYQQGDSSFSSNGRPANAHVTNVSVSQDPIFNTQLLHCVVDGISIRVCLNRVDVLESLALFETADRLISQNHLLKRTLLLFKAWAKYQARIMGPDMLSGFAIERIVLTVFNGFHEKIKTPLQAFFKILSYLDAFDWQWHALSLYGPVVLSSLPSSTVLAHRSTCSFPRENSPIIGKKILSKYTFTAPKLITSMAKVKQDTQGQNRGLELGPMNIILQTADGKMYNNLTLDISRESASYILRQIHDGVQNFRTAIPIEALLALDTNKHSQHSENFIHAIEAFFGGNNQMSIAMHVQNPLNEADIRRDSIMSEPNSLFLAGSSRRGSILSLSSLNTLAATTVTSNSKEDSAASSEDLISDFSSEREKKGETLSSCLPEREAEVQMVGGASPVSRTRWGINSRRREVQPKQLIADAWRCGSVPAETTLLSQKSGAKTLNQITNTDLLATSIEDILQKLAHAKQFQSPIDITETQLVAIIAVVLDRHGKLPIGALGRMIRTAINSFSLPQVIQDCGGIKAFLIEHNYAFTLGENHPNNPLVHLKKSSGASRGGKATASADPLMIDMVKRVVAQTGGTMPLPQNNGGGSHTYTHQSYGVNNNGRRRSGGCGGLKRNQAIGGYRSRSVRSWTSGGSTRGPSGSNQSHYYGRHTSISNNVTSRTTRNRNNRNF